MMTKLLALLLLLSSVCATSSCTSTASLGRLNLDENGVALHGYDPVSYHAKDGPARGTGRLTQTFDGAVYLFANEDNLTRFRRDPAYYAPLYGGWCAWAMVDGEKVDVDPKNFIVTPKGLFLFYKSFLIDTREKWLDGNPEELAAKADAMWEKLEADWAREHPGEH